MLLEKSSNPAFKKFEFSQAISQEDSMTIKGTVNKSFLLLGIVIVAASITWNMAFDRNAYVGMLTTGGAIMGFIFALITMFKTQWAAVTAPLYAVAEGLFLGGISAFIESAFVNQEVGLANGSSGIVMNAVALTFGVFLVMLLLYRNEIIKPTQRFMMIIVGGIGAIALVYLASFIAGLFGANPFAAIFSNGPIGIGFSLVVIVLAALSLILDFKFIEDSAKQGAPKHMEWYGAFGIMVTLIWLYLEILRLLSKLQRE